MTGDEPTLDANDADAAVDAADDPEGTAEHLENCPKRPVVCGECGYGRAWRDAELGATAELQTACACEQRLFTLASV